MKCLACNPLLSPMPEDDHPETAHPRGQMVQWGFAFMDSWKGSLPWGVWLQVQSPKLPHKFPNAGHWQGLLTNHFQVLHMVVTPCGASHPNLFIHCEILYPPGQHPAGLWSMRGISPRWASLKSIITMWLCRSPKDSWLGVTASEWRWGKVTWWSAPFHPKSLVSLPADDGSWEGYGLHAL